MVEARMNNRHDSYFGRAARVGLLLAVVLSLMGLASGVRLPRGGEEDARSGAQGEELLPGLTVLRADRLPAGNGVRERLWLLNPSPLYMPGGDEAGPAGLPERPGGRAAESFAPAFVFSERWPGREILRPASLDSEVGAVEILSGPRWFEGLSRSGEIGPAIPLADTARKVRFTVYRSGFSIPEAAFDREADGILGLGNWRPVDLNVVIGEVGAVSRPSVTISSGDDGVDEWVRRIVSRELLSRISLRPGIYRVEVSP
jgi:hypothetical protein